MGKKVYLFSLCVSMVLVSLWGWGEAFSATLAVTKNGVGGGTVTSSPAGINCGSDCTEAYPQGKKVTLKAKADVDSTFAGWYGGECEQTQGNCTVTMNSDLTIFAAFTPKTVDFSLTADEIDFGEVEIGSKVSKTLAITNIGTATIQVEISGLQGTEFSIGGRSTVSLKPGRSYKLKVSFKPKNEEVVETSVDAEPMTAEEEDAEAMGLGKIIDVAQINIQASYKGQSKSQTVNVKAIKTVPSKLYQIKFDNKFKLLDGGITNGYTVTEKGNIEFEMLNDHIVCYNDLTQQYITSCFGFTELTVKGKLVGDEGNSCTLEGNGHVDYEVSGSVVEGGILQADLKLTSPFRPEVTMCCQTKQGSVCQAVPGFLSLLNNIYEKDAKFLTKIPFHNGGKDHREPNQGGLEISLTWELIFP